MGKIPDLFPGDIVVLADKCWHTRLWDRPGQRPENNCGGVSGDEICIVIAKTTKPTDLYSVWFCVMTSRSNVGWTNRVNRFKYVES